MVVIDKQSLKLFVLLFIESLEENSTAYNQACDILLTMAGVSDAEGNLSEQYRQSEFWQGGHDGTPLRPSAKAEIAAKLPPELHHLLNT